MSLKAQTIAEAFREIRRRSMSLRTGLKGMYQKELAERLGITSSNISRIENSTINQRPSDKLLEKVAAEFSELTTYEELSTIRAQSPEPDRRSRSERAGESDDSAGRTEMRASTRGRAERAGQASLVAYVLPQVHALANSLSSEAIGDSTPPVALRTRFIAAATFAVGELDRSFDSGCSDSLRRIAATGLVGGIWRLLNADGGGDPPTLWGQTVLGTLAREGESFLDARLDNHPTTQNSDTRVRVVLAHLLGPGQVGLEHA